MICTSATHSPPHFRSASDYGRTDASKLAAAKRKRMKNGFVRKPFRFVFAVLIGQNALCFSFYLLIFCAISYS